MGADGGGGAQLDVEEKQRRTRRPGKACPPEMAPLGEPGFLKFLPFFQTVPSPWDRRPNT